MSISKEEQEEKWKQLESRLEEISLVITNLVHEIEILKQALFRQGSLSPTQWEECFQIQKSKFLENPRGTNLKMLQRYQYDPQEWFEDLTYR